MAPFLGTGKQHKDDDDDDDDCLQIIFHKTSRGCTGGGGDGGAPHNLIGIRFMLLCVMLCLVYFISPTQVLLGLVIAIQLVSQ